MKPKKGISVSMSTSRSNPHEAMDAETVAGLLGVSTRMLSNYINLNGLPSSGSGRTRTFVWSEVREWFVGYRMQLEMGGGNDGNEDSDFSEFTSETGPAGKEDIRGATLRKTKAEANLKELALGKQRGEVITIEDVRVKLERMLGNLSAQLGGLPVKLADRLETARTRSARETLLREEIDALRRELSTGSIVDFDPSPTDDVEEDDDTLELQAAAAGFDYGFDEDDPLTLEAAPLECVQCRLAMGPLAIVGADHPGWMCDACTAHFDGIEVS